MTAYVADTYIHPPNTPPHTHSLLKTDAYAGFKCQLQSMMAEVNAMKAAFDA